MKTKKKALAKTPAPATPKTAAVDYYPNPGTFAVVAIDGRGRLTLARGGYRTETDADWDASEFTHCAIDDGSLERFVVYRDEQLLQLPGLMTQTALMAEAEREFAKFQGDTQTVYELVCGVTGDVVERSFYKADARKSLQDSRDDGALSRFIRERQVKLAPVA